MLPFQFFCSRKTLNHSQPFYPLKQRHYKIDIILYAVSKCIMCNTCYLEMIVKSKTKTQKRTKPQNTITAKQHLFNYQYSMHTNTNKKVYVCGCKSAVACNKLLHVRAHTENCIARYKYDIQPQAQQRSSMPSLLMSWQGDAPSTPNAQGCLEVMNGKWFEAAPMSAVLYALPLQLLAKTFVARLVVTPHWCLMRAVCNQSALRVTRQRGLRLYSLGQATQLIDYSMTACGRCIATLISRWCIYNKKKIK